VAQLRSHYHRIKEAGGEVLLVSFYPPDRTENWARRFDLPFKVASDPSRDVYRRYGLGTAQGLDAHTFASVMEGIKGFIKIGRIPEHIQHWDQLGGYFVVNSKGEVLYAHVCQSAIDNPPVEELLAAMQVKDA
jgi:alkyl hydroperoxide reductase subunit AhpC